MQSDGICVLPEQLRHLVCVKPDGLALQPHFHCRGPVLGPVDDNLALVALAYACHRLTPCPVMW